MEIAKEMDRASASETERSLSRAEDNTNYQAPTSPLAPLANSATTPTHTLIQSHTSTHHTNTHTPALSTPHATYLYEPMPSMETPPAAFVSSTASETPLVLPRWSANATTAPARLQSSSLESLKLRVQDQENLIRALVAQVDAISKASPTGTHTPHTLTHTRTDTLAHPAPSSPAPSSGVATQASHQNENVSISRSYYLQSPDGTLVPIAAPPDFSTQPGTQTHTLTQGHTLTQSSTLTQPETHTFRPIAAASTQAGEQASPQTFFQSSPFPRVAAAYAYAHDLPLPPVRTTYLSAPQSRVQTHFPSQPQSLLQVQGEAQAQAQVQTQAQVREDEGEDQGLGEEGWGEAKGKEEMGPPGITLHFDPNEPNPMSAPHRRRRRGCCGF